MAATNNNLTCRLMLANFYLRNSVHEFDILVLHCQLIQLFLCYMSLAHKAIGANDSIILNKYICNHYCC